MLFVLLFIYFIGKQSRTDVETFLMICTFIAAIVDAVFTASYLSSVVKD